MQLFDKLKALSEDSILTFFNETLLTCHQVDYPLVLPSFQVTIVENEKEKKIKKKINCLVIKTLTEETVIALESLKEEQKVSELKDALNMSDCLVKMKVHGKQMLDWLSQEEEEEEEDGDEEDEEDA
jgi:hypothetical protein